MKKMTTALFLGMCVVGIAGLAIRQVQPSQHTEPETVIYDKNGNKLKWRHEAGATHHVYDNKTHKMITIEVNPDGTEKK